MSEIGELVFGDDPVGSGDSLELLLVPAAPGNVAGSTSQCFVLRPKLCAVGVFHRGEVPIDLQAVARLLRGPELVGYHGNAGTFNEGNLEYLAHACNTASCLIVKALDPCTKDGRMRHDGRLHAGKVEVEAKLDRAIALGATVKPPNSLAHETELCRILELHRGRHGLLCGRFRQCSVSG